MNTTTDRTDEKLTELERVQAEMRARYDVANAKRNAAHRAWMADPSKENTRACDDVARELDRCEHAVRLATQDLEFYRLEKHQREVAAKRAELEGAKEAAKGADAVEALASRIAPVIFEFVTTTIAMAENEILALRIEAELARDRAHALLRELGEPADVNGHPIVRAVDEDAIRRAVREKIETLLREHGKREMLFPEWLQYVTTSTYAVPGSAA